jgi:hypothetical protein
MKLETATMNDAPPMSMLDRTAADLLKETSPRTARPLQRNLSNVLRRLALVISHRREEFERPAFDRVQLAQLLKKTSDHMRKLADALEALDRQPFLGRMLYEPEGVIQPLQNRAQAMDALRLAAAQTKAWQLKVRGAGRHTPADLMDVARPELISAIAVVRLYQQLSVRRPTSRNDLDCSVCEDLWRASGGAPAESFTRWRNYLAKARSQKPVRAGALKEAKQLVDGCFEEGNTLALARPPQFQ